MVTFQKPIAQTPSLGGVREKVVPVAQTQTSKVVYLKPTTKFQKRHSWFWWIFETTFCWLLSMSIERRSMRILLNKIAQKYSPGQEYRILSKGRRNFGNNCITELFKLRTSFFNRWSALMRHFCENVARAEALDDVYNVNGEFVLNGKPTLPAAAQPDFWSKLYLNSPNGQSVRNRYHMVFDLYQSLGGGDTISIACGSAQPLIHAFSKLKEERCLNGAKIWLTDISQDSLAVAYVRAVEAGIGNSVVCLQASFNELVEKTNGKKFDIVEACGILDYLPDKVAISLIKTALQMLKEDGHLILSNMVETRAAHILRRMYNWEIAYRSPEEFTELIAKAGGKNMHVNVEPWGIHAVATAVH